MAAETLDLEAVAVALLKTGGNLYPASTMLGCRPTELRIYCKAHPELMAAALEARELELDRAEARLLKALRTGPLGQRIQAAAYIVRRQRKAR